VAIGFEHGGGLAGPECYRCLTTTSKLWHQYGKLSLSMCNGCVAVKAAQGSSEAIMIVLPLSQENK